MLLPSCASPGSREPSDLLAVLPTGLWATQPQKHEAMEQDIISLLDPHLRSSIEGWELFWAGVLRSGLEEEETFIVSLFKERIIAPSPGVNMKAIFWLGTKNTDLQGGALLDVTEWGGWSLLSANAVYYLGMDVLRLEFGQMGPTNLVDFIITPNGPVIVRALRLSDSAWSVYSHDSDERPVFELTMLNGKDEAEPLDSVADWRALALNVLPGLPEHDFVAKILRAVAEDSTASGPPVGLHARETQYAVLPEQCLLYVFYLDDTALRLQAKTLEELLEECEHSGQKPALEATLHDISRRNKPTVNGSSDVD